MRKDNRVAVVQRTLLYVTVLSTAQKPLGRLVKSSHHFDSPVTDVLSVQTVSEAM